MDAESLARTIIDLCLNAAREVNTALEVRTLLARLPAEERHRVVTGRNKVNRLAFNLIEFTQQHSLEGNYGSRECLCKGQYEVGGNSD